MPINIWSCSGCTSVTTVAKEWKRFRGSLWCRSCHALAKAGLPTPLEQARAKGEDDRNGLTRALDAWASKPTGGPLAP